MYLSGAGETGSLWTNPFNGNYRYEMDNKDNDWLRDSIKNRWDNLTGRNNSIKPTKDGLSRFRANSKDLVPKMVDLKKNPDQIRGMSRDQQNSWLRGYLDGKLTINLKRPTEPTSRLVDKNPARLKLARDLLKKNGVDATLKPKSDKLGPHLQIKGKDNHQNLYDNLKPENPTSIDRLENLLRNPDRFEKKDANERQRLGREFEKPLGDALKQIYPDSKLETKPKLEPGNKNSPTPDFRLTHPDGTKEIIDGKLGEDDIGPKDYNYGKYADKLGLYYLEGKEKPNENRNGKPVEYNAKNNLNDKLDKAKENAKDNRTRNKIDRIKDRINRIADKAKQAKEKLDSNKDSKSNSEQKDKN